MTALVTGATGFIGGNVARRLRRRGDAVRVLVRPGANDLAIRDTGVVPVAGDLLEPDSLRRALEGCDAVYHCAAVYAFWARRPADIYRANVDGTRNVIAAARQAGVRRMVFTSSVSTIGLPPGQAGKTDKTGKTDRTNANADGGAVGMLGDETMPPQPAHLIGHYKQSKYQAERLALAANDGNLEVVVVNPCAPVGKWDVKPTPTGRILLDFARGRIPGYLDTGLNLVDVDDVAEGHLLAMERGRPGERYILGHRNLTLREVFTMLGGITGRRAPRIRFPYWLVGGVAVCDQWLEGGVLRRSPAIPIEGIKIARHPMYVSSGKAVSELGLPQSPVENALEKAVRWFTDYGYLR